ncbi:GspH/FimT family pseudopilin [Pseudomonas sp. 2FE]|uniref:GspH/FimT family pseudopilin n=1 Tax=Pseudomonas sp. 2FE TaxID=2502190 RepID=UPI0010F462A0|nr:GspH/FimT family pseudopilin [Pseudomonas sp. 2FE]
MTWSTHIQLARQLSRRAAVRSGDQRGFTLVELMVAVVVMAILLGIAIPSFTDVTLSSKLRSQANDLVAGATLARSEAIKRNQPVTFCASADGASCATSGGWQQGWIVQSSDGTVILVHPAVASGFLITGSVHSITFQPTGVGATSTALTVCRATPSVGSQERVVNISLTGRTSVTKTTTASCS